MKLTPSTTTWVYILFAAMVCFAGQAIYNYEIGDIATYRHYTLLVWMHLITILLVKTGDQ